MPADLSGKHTIEIEMSNNDFAKDKMNLVANKFSLRNPQVRLINAVLGLDSIKLAENISYLRKVKSWL